MWTPEEKEDRVNSLLEFLNNEYKNQHNNDVEINRDNLSDPDQWLGLIIGFENLVKSIQYQIERRSGGPIKKEFEYGNKAPGITNYIAKVSKEELKDLKEKAELHLYTLFLYRLPGNLLI